MQVGRILSCVCASCCGNCLPVPFCSTASLCFYSTVRLDSQFTVCTARIAGPANLKFGVAPVVVRISGPDCLCFSARIDDNGAADHHSTGTEHKEFGAASENVVESRKDYYR